jgi:predicted transcriptional regulator
MTTTNPGRRRERPKRAQVHPRLPEDLSKRLRTFAGGKGASQSSVIQLALTRYLDDANEAAVILRRVDRLARAVTRVHRDVVVVADALAVFVQIYLAHTPRIPDEGRAHAEEDALVRFDHFWKHVCAIAVSGRSVLDDIVRDEARDADALASAAGVTKRGNQP